MSDYNVAFEQKNFMQVLSKKMMLFGMLPE